MTRYELELDLGDELATPHLNTPAFLQLPQAAWPVADAEKFLGRCAERGYLLVSIADDAAAHGDAPFRQTRGTAPPMPAAPFWQRNAKFHNWLCDQSQEHLPLRFGLDPTGPAALAWLIPAPKSGEIKANGFAQSWPLDAPLREQWLLAWARRIGQQLHPAQRLLLQLPGAAQPAYWFYRTYRGDLPLLGTQYTRAVTLLASLPRYFPNAEQGPEPSRSQDEGSGELFVNDYPPTWGQTMVRCRDHFELSPFWTESAYY